MASYPLPMWTAFLLPVAMLTFRLEGLGFQGYRDSPTVQ